MRQLGANTAFVVFVATAVALIGVLHLATEQRAADGRVSDPPPLRYKNPDRPVMLVVGDSFSGGSDMNSGPEWPELIGETHDWAVVKDAVGGTGYVTSEPGATQTFLQRSTKTIETYEPDLIVLAGGINDLGRESIPTIAAGAARELNRLRQGFPNAKFVMLSNFVSGKSDSTADGLAAALRDVAQTAEVPFVDVTRFLTPDLIGEDKVHPTDRGHEELAERIDSRLVQFGLVDAIAVPEYLLG